MPIHTYSPHNADGLKECDVHEADGGGVVVNQVEPVDPTLQPTNNIFSSELMVAE